jgi:hypothetical protein
MKDALRWSLVWIPLLLGAGCGQPAAAPPTGSAGTESDNTPPVVANGSEHGRSGWWCAEHGVPEAKCSRCSSKVAAECQKKGDWCDEHDRAKSQCFICDPKAKENYAAQYRAREGKEPPPITDREEGEST